MFSPPGEMWPISAEASRGLSHLTSGTSKGSFTPLLQLMKFLDIPVSTRGSTRVLPTSRGAPFTPPSSRGGILSLRGRERIPGITVACQEEAFSTGKARGTPGSYHHSQSPPDISVHSRETCFPCTASTFKPRIDSQNGGTWDSSVGKPRVKASRERHRSLDPREEKHDTAATDREEIARAWPHSR